jgi:hypothetical protein
VGRGHVGLVRPFVAAAAVGVASALLVAGAAAAAVPWTPVLTGSTFSPVTAPAAYVARTAVGTRRFAHGLDPADVARARAVDFSRFVVVAVVAPFPSCGWRVNVRAVERAASTLRVRYSAVGPAKGAVVCQAETTAYAVVRVARPRVTGALRAVPVRVS